MFKAGNQLIKYAKCVYQQGQKTFYGCNKLINNNLTRQQIETIKEFTGGVAIAGGAHQANKFYKENPEAFTQKNILENLGRIAQKTLPAGHSSNPVQKVRIDINHASDNLVFTQDSVNYGRGAAANLSPLFTAMPMLANFAFRLTSALSVGDVMTIGQILRIKEMVSARPDIFTSSDQKKEYDALITKIEKHIPKALGFDILKISYRGQLAAVNKELRKKAHNQKTSNETDVKLQYQMGFLKELADKRMIPDKSNLPVVGWIFPTSLLISQLSAHDTRELTHDIKELDAFFKKIIFKGEEGEGEDSLHHQTQQEAIVVKTEPNQEAKKETNQNL